MDRARVFERVYVASARLLTVLDGKAEPAPGVHVLPLTQLQKEIWDCLAGKALLSKEVRKRISSLPSDAAIRKHVQAIRATGREIEFVPRLGYVRPDAPPPASE